MWCREQDFEPRRRGSTSNWTITHKAHLDHDITRAIAHYKGMVYLKKKTEWKFHRLTLIDEDLGNGLDRVTGKIIRQKFIRFLSWSGHEPDRIPGKLIQLSIFEFKGMTQTVLTVASKSGPSGTQRVFIVDFDHKPS